MRWPGRRRIAVLGTMAELGAGSELEHRHLADHARGRTIELVTVAEPTYGVNGDAACGDRSAAIAHLASLGLGNGDVVLVKASRSAGLEEVVAALLAPVP
jgi:UDP-N-acetylmuramoyl-tripeptide--D-alanyl-D-alanine ligase